MSPNLRAHVERFIQTLKCECLNRFVIVAEKHLDYVCRVWSRHYNEERPHSSVLCTIMADAKRHHLEPFAYVRDLLLKLSSLCAECGVDTPDFTEASKLSGPEFRELGMSLARQLPEESLTALRPDRWAAANPADVLVYRMEEARQLANRKRDDRQKSRNKTAAAPLTPAPPTMPSTDRRRSKWVPRTLTVELRAIVALSRWGGLRIPSEPFVLQWQHVDWERQRVSLPAVKTRTRTREIPLFPEVPAAIRQLRAVATESGDASCSSGTVTSVTRACGSE